MKKLLFFVTIVLLTWIQNNFALTATVINNSAKDAEVHFVFAAHGYKMVPVAAHSQTSKDFGKDCALNRIQVLTPGTKYKVDTIGATCLTDKDLKIVISDYDPKANRFKYDIIK